MTPGARIAIVVNPGSGTDDDDDVERTIRQAFAPSGAVLSFVALEADVDLAAELRRLIDEGTTVVVAAGGDGTVNAVADAILGRDVSFGVLPMGTLNHFAKDVGIPVELEAAVAVVVAGHAVPVDAGSVNDRTFLNNASVGLYPRILKLREQHEARGKRKWAVAAWATLRVVRQAAPMRVRLSVDGVDVTRTTPLIFVGNNAYRMAGKAAASRDSLQDGRLALYLVRTTGQWHLLRLALRILAGTARESGDLAMIGATEAEIDLPGDVAQSGMDVALDGEVTAMPLPLHFRIRPGALRVLVPRDGGAVDAG